MASTPAQVITTVLTANGISAAKAATLTPLIVTALGISSQGYRSDGSDKSHCWFNAIGVPAAPQKCLPLRTVYRLTGCE
jgi:hypothetical protein